MNSNEHRVLVWDWPIRIFHWGFALSAGAALVIALSTEEDGPLFMWHMPLGIAAAFFLVLRGLLALFGSRPNRLASLFFSPRETLRYFGGVLNRNTPSYGAHNPGSAINSLLMFALIPLLVWTGVRGEAGEDVHGIIAYVLLGSIAVHVAGLLLHHMRHGEAIALSMIHGFKRVTATLQPTPAHRWSGLAVAVVALAWTAQLFQHFDPNRGTLRIPVLGSTLSLGEGEEEEHEDDGHEDNEEDDD